MYNVCTCIYTVCTCLCICNVCTWYIPNNSKHLLEFHGKEDQRDSEDRAWQAVTGWTPAEQNHILQVPWVPFGVWNGSQSVPNVIFLICQNTAFMKWIKRYCIYFVQICSYIVHTLTYMHILVIYMVYTMVIELCTWSYLNIQLCCVQDTILVIPPYPYCIEEVSQDVLLEDCWYARPQRLFTCHLRPKGGRPPKNPSYSCCSDDVSCHLVFLSTFEELKLPISRPTESAGVTKLYEPFPMPCLYVAPAACIEQSSTDFLIPGW
jgi:hypothetical protein